MNKDIKLELTITDGIHTDYISPKDLISVSEAQILIELKRVKIKGIEYALENPMYCCEEEKAILFDAKRVK